MSQPNPIEQRPGFGDQRHWPARLELGYDRVEERTRMHTMQFLGPLRVQRPFYPETGVCHTYLLHPPGGVVSGDDLSIQIQGKPGSHALITTPSAGKIYRADTHKVLQRQHTQIRLDQASCEWLPMETIVFDGAHGQLESRVDLTGDCRFIGLEMICLGRPASSLPFATGRIDQQLSLYHDGIPLLLDRQCLQGGSELLPSNAGFHGYTVSGTLLAFGFSTSQLDLIVEDLREQLPAQSEHGWLSVTHRLGLLVVRYLGQDSEAGMQQLRQAWSLLRPRVLGVPACVPRIWLT